MAELATRSVQKMTLADWLPSRAISFSYRPASFGGKISELIWRKTNQIQVRFTEEVKCLKKLNVLNDNFTQIFRWTNAKTTRP